MTPKAKAIELVDKMGFSTSHTIDNTSGERTPIYINQWAKECALIAVYEIKKALGTVDKMYWDEVEQEIKNL